MFAVRNPTSAISVTDFRLAFVDEIRAGFSMLAVEKRLAHREDAAADAIASVDDGDRGPFFRELARGSEAGQSSPGDENGSAAHAAC